MISEIPPDETKKKTVVVTGRLLFPLWKFWTYMPHGWLAAIVWNVCELLHIQCPFAPTLFGWIIGMKGTRIK